MLFQKKKNFSSNLCIRKGLRKASEIMKWTDKTKLTIHSRDNNRTWFQMDLEHPVKKTMKIIYSVYICYQVIFLNGLFRCSENEWNGIWHMNHTAF